MDGLWNGLEKAGLRPDRLLLEWCSAAEGARWQTIMKEAEKKRQSVSPEEIAETRAVLAEFKAPGPRNPKKSDQNRQAAFGCMCCAHQWTGIFNPDSERRCPTCRSSSVRWLREENSSAK
jgi:hypothetical protein